jgi:phenylacetate-CoA ligase
LERWADIPVLTKNEVLENRDRIFINDTPKESGAIRTGWTSGSEGQPLNYARTGLADFVSTQATQRFMRWWKLDGSQRLAHIKATRQPTGTVPPPVVRRGWYAGAPTGERHVFPAGVDLQRHLEWLQKIEPAYLKSYPELLGELARLSLRQGRVLRFKLLISGGGVLTDDIRRLCSDAFACKVADFYGAEEVGSIAAECPVCGDYHVADENVLLEVLKDDGTEAQPGETGRAVLTTLFNHALPLIRYQVGDYVEAGGGGIQCSLSLQRIRRIRGRYKSMFRLPGGQMVWPFIPAGEIGRIANVRRFQLVQVALDRVEFHYVPKNAEVGVDALFIDAIVKTHIDPSLTTVSVPVHSIDREDNLKYPLYRSLVADTA